jgi:hypothetical protein
MPNTYHFSLAFNSSTSGQLQTGAVLADPGTTPTASNWDDLNPLDQVQIYMYDQNSANTGNLVPSLASGWVTITPPSSNPNASLFNATVPTGVTYVGQMQSVIFGGPYACFAVAASNGAAVFPNVIANEPANSTTSFGVTLQISCNGNTYTSSDPTMIVKT